MNKILKEIGSLTYYQFFSQLISYKSSLLKLVSNYLNFMAQSCRRLIEGWCDEQKSIQRQQRISFSKYQVLSEIKVPFFPHNPVLDLKNTQSIANLQVMANQITHLECSQEDFLVFLSSLTKMMALKSLIGPGIRVILAILPKMRYLQIGVLLDIIDNQMLCYWVSQNQEDSLQFILYLCQTDKRWKDKLSSEQVKLFAKHIYRNKSLAHSLFLLDFMVYLLQQDDFQEDMLENSQFLLGIWLQEQPFKCYRLIELIVSRQYVQTLQKYQIYGRILFFVSNKDLFRSSKLFIQCLGLMVDYEIRFELSNMLYVDRTVDALSGVDWDSCWSHLDEGERILFYNFLYQMSNNRQHYDHFNQNFLGLLEQIKNSGLKYEQDFGSYFSIKVVQDIQLIPI